MSALERGVIYILKLIESRDKMREKIKSDFAKFQKTEKKGLMSLETLAGLKKRDDIRKEVEDNLRKEPKKFHAEYKSLDPKTEILSQNDTLHNLTLFTKKNNSTIFQSRVQGKPLEYFKRPIMPGVDLRKEADYQQKKNDTLKNLNYFSFDNTSSMVATFNNVRGDNPKYGVRTDYSKSTKTLRKNDSRKRFTNTARNLLDSDGGGDRRDRGYGMRNGPVDRDSMARKMMDAFRRKEAGRTGGGLINRVDVVYESLFKKDF